MLPTSSLRALRVRAPQVQGIRFSSHDAPQYNEPSGWLFGEKVRILFTALFMPDFLSFLYFQASTARPKTSERGLGKHMVHWDVRFDGVCHGDAILQTRHQVSMASSRTSLFLDILEQHTDVGFEGGQGENGSPWGEVPI